ncbi:MAG: glycosyltransferase family 4 protein [Candidatus Promineifilaceae bacterium]|nr:glycosyltransferase family 4 protein [Candidatus Promineifilaceae bacterium]
MRILHVVHQYPPEHTGGTELYTQTVARRQATSGHSVAVFYPSVEPAGEEEGALACRTDEAGVRVYSARLGARSRTKIFLSVFASPSAERLFADVLARETPDLVHVQHLMGLPAALVDRLQAAGVPYVVSLHDYWYRCANAQLITNTDQRVCRGPEAWLNCGACVLARGGLENQLWLRPALAPLLAYRSRLLRLALEGAEAIIAPTAFVRDMYTSLGIPAEQITVLPLGLEMPAELSLETERRRDGDAPAGGGPLHVVYVGSIAPQKGVHVLVEAVNALPAEAVQLSIFGSLAAYPEYVEQLRAPALHPRIHFAGSVSREALWPMLMETADVLVVPSLWYEGSPAVTREAFAAGVPVVASRLGALAEQVDDGVNGLLFPAGDAKVLAATLARLYEEPALLPRLRAGIQPVRSMAGHVAHVERLYRSIL